MNCKALHNKLIFFLDNDLSDNEMEQVRIHLDVCPECAAFAEDMKKTLGVLQKERSIEVNPFFYTRLKAKLENQSVRTRQGSFFPVWERIVQPAVFSLLLLAGIYSGYKIAEPEKIDFKALAGLEGETIPYLNEMQAEPIETFLMEQDHDNEK